MAFISFTEGQFLYFSFYIVKIISLLSIFAIFIFIYKTCNSVDSNLEFLYQVGRRETQLLDDLGNRQRYWELKKEAEDKKKVEMTVHHTNNGRHTRNLPRVLGAANKQCT